MMKRADKLMTMKGADLIRVADDLGVKVACNKARTALKESKQAVIDRIIAKETKLTAVEEKEVIEEIAAEDKAVVTECVEPVKAVKIARTRKTTVEDRIKSIPLVANIRLVVNNKGEVRVLRNNKMIFKHCGPVLVCNSDKYLNNVEHDKRNYGYRVAPTTENMMAILANA